MRISNTHTFSHLNYKGSLIAELNQKTAASNSAGNNSKPKEDSPFFNLGSSRYQRNLLSTKLAYANPNTVVATLLGTFGVLFLALYNRKNIADFFGKSNQQAKNKAESIAQKFNLPKPQFTPNATPELHAKEKSDYIKSIWNEFIDISETKPLEKEKNLLGLKELYYHGSFEDLKNLPLEYKTSKDNKIFLGFVKFLNKVGLDSEEIKYLKLALNRENTTYTERTIKEIIKGLHEYGVNTAPKGYWTEADTGLSEELKFFSEKYKKNKNIKAKAQALIQRIEDDIQPDKT